MKAGIEVLDEQISSVKDNFKQRFLENRKDKDIISHNTELLKNLSVEPKEIKRTNVPADHLEDDALIEETLALEKMQQGKVKLAEKAGDLEGNCEEMEKIVVDQQLELLNNLRLCFGLELEELGGQESLRVFHLSLPIDGNYNSIRRRFVLN